MSSNIETKPLEIQYICGKCKKKVNTDHFFCAKCRIQYKIGESQ